MRHRENQLIRSNPRSSVYLACGLLLRGNVEISDVNSNIQRLQSEVRMVHWNQEGFKVGICGVPPIGQAASLLCLSNNCCIRDTFQRMHDRFRRLYLRRAHLHHYTEFMDADVLSQAFENVKHLINEYARLEGSAGGDISRFPNSVPSSRRRLQPLI
jgi:tubulin epsilon